MPGAPDREIPIPVRRFAGTMLALDPAFVQAGWLTHAENWVPELTYVLGKRRGSEQWQRLPSAGRVDPMCYATATDGTRYLYVLAGDALYVSTNDGALAPVSNGAFSPPPDSRYGMAVVGDTLYVGNDTDPIKEVPLGAAAIDLAPIPLLDDTGQAAALVDDSLARVLAGTYSYRWATYDPSTGRWAKLGPVRTITTGATGRQRIAFTAPSVALTGAQRYHLFLAGVNQEIEGAHDQTTDGLGAAAGWALWDDPGIEGPGVPSPSTVVRRGAHLVAHRGRLWGAGGLDSTARRAWASNVLVPGLEQTLFDQALFFPAAAVTPDLGDPVTALVVATLTSTNRSPTSPLALFTATSTWLFFGDPLDDPQATLVQVSGDVGCPSDRTAVATPHGVVFCGKRSVYLLAPSQAEPKDIGWPIEPAVRAQPVAERNRAWAIYHKGFYKLALVPAGAVEPTEQWWLDLRRGLDDPPSWWGPHTTPGYSAAARTAMHPAEDDRAWAAQVNASPLFVLLDQTDRYTDPLAPRAGGQWNVAQWNVDQWAMEQSAAIVSRLTTAMLDAATPLTPKIAKRARVVARVYDTTSLGVLITGDMGYSAAGTLAIPIPLGDVWDTAEWDTSEWAMLHTVLSEFECPVPEPRAHAYATTLTHVDPLPCEIRDFELRVQPSSRETR